MTTLRFINDYLVEWEYVPPDTKLTRYSDLDKPRIREAIAQYQREDGNVAQFKAMTGDSLSEDGVVGPATYMAMNMPRCGMKKEQLAAVEEVQGRGSWYECAGAKGHHSAICMLRESNVPSWLKPHLKIILKHAQAAYAKHGLLWRFVNEQGIDLLTGENLSQYGYHTFLNWERGNGWIGLAIVGGLLRCSQKIWLKLDNRYGSGYDEFWLVNQVFLVLVHELGHNCSFGHFGDTYMNPSVQRNTTKTLYGLENRLDGLFGGEPVPIPGDPEPPTPEPPKPHPGVIVRTSEPYKRLDAPGIYAEFRIG